MRKVFTAVLLAAIVFLFAANAKAQMPADPTHWTYMVEQKGEGRYELVFDLKLEEGWHIYAMDPGGDGTAIPPSFEFDSNPAIIKESEIAENGKLKVETIEDIGTFRWYADKVKYVQPVRASENATVTGKHVYQVCNDMLCLPPVTKTFSFDIKAK